MGSSVIEGNRVDSVVVGIIVLEQPLRSAIENFDFLISSTRSETGAIRMELNLVDHTSMISELLNLLLYFLAPGDIPEPDSSVI